MDDSRDQNLEELLFMFELTQSVGLNLDPLNNCWTFVLTILARRNFSFGSIWLKHALTGIDCDENPSLFYAAQRHAHSPPVSHASMMLSAKVHFP
jgi:hypothetical protein